MQYIGLMKFYRLSLDDTLMVWYFVSFRYARWALFNFNFLDHELFLYEFIFSLSSILISRKICSEFFFQNQNQDQSPTLDCYYAHSLKNLISVCVTPALSRKKYHVWALKMRRSLDTKNKFMFIDGLNFWRRTIWI